jgi:cytidylate kinase
MPASREHQGGIVAYQVVTIARTLGAGGEDVGRAVADQLGFSYADDEIISAAAERAGVSKIAVEKAEQRPGLIARILDTMAGIPVEPSIYYGQALAMPQAAVAVGYDELIRDVIVGTAARGKVVIVAHGSGICLASTAGVLRVLVTASPEVRAARVASAAGVDVDRAKKAVAGSDSERQDFLKRFYDVKQELPTHYDLVLNTDTVSVADGARLVVAAARF